MQQPVPSNPHHRSGFSALAGIVGAVALPVALLAAVALPGCEPVAGPDTVEAKPHSGVTLTLHCPDAGLADALEPAVRVWEAKSGATVTIRREPAPAAGDDLRVIPAMSLGEVAETGDLRTLPARLRAADHPLQWFGLLPPYAERLIEWGGQPLALPLAGDGYILAYRADRFTPADPKAREALREDFRAFAEARKLPVTELKAPAAWEDLAAVAAFFAARHGRPSLPPLPADSAQLFDLFCRVAACYDRRAMADAEVAKLAGDADALAFQFLISTGKPRLNTKGFEAAARWLAGLHASKSLPGGAEDPVAAIQRDDGAVLAVLSLDQLALLRDASGLVPAKYGVAPLPGAREYYAFDGKPVQVGSPNYVPYFAGGRVGVVRTRCPHPDAAFDLLAELAGPARSSEVVATPGLGAGPFRLAHIDRDRLVMWLGYGFDEKLSPVLQDAMRHYVSQTVKNATYGLRGPDRADLTAAGADWVRKVATGAATPEEGVRKMNEAWEAADAKRPAAEVLRWRRRASGQQ